MVSLKNTLILFLGLCVWIKSLLIVWAREYYWVYWPFGIMKILIMSLWISIESFVLSVMGFELLFVCGMCRVFLNLWGLGKSMSTIRESSFDCNCNTYR